MAWSQILKKPWKGVSVSRLVQVDPNPQSWDDPTLMVYLTLGMQKECSEPRVDQAQVPSMKVFSNEPLVSLAPLFPYPVPPGGKQMVDVPFYLQ